MLPFFSSSRIVYVCGLYKNKNIDKHVKLIIFPEVEFSFLFSHAVAGYSASKFCRYIERELFIFYLSGKYKFETLRSPQWISLCLKGVKFQSSCLLLFATFRIYKNNKYSTLTELTRSCLCKVRSPKPLETCCFRPGCP